MTELYSHLLPDHLESTLNRVTFRVRVAPAVRKPHPNPTQSAGPLTSASEIFVVSNLQALPVVGRAGAGGITRWMMLRPLIF